MKNLVVMLPTLDEEYGLREILPLIPKAKLGQMGWKTEIWVIDGGSSDLSIEIAEQYECEIIKQAGFGKAQCPSLPIGVGTDRGSAFCALCACDHCATLRNSSLRRFFAAVAH